MPRPRSRYPDLYYRVRGYKTIELLHAILEETQTQEYLSEEEALLLAKEVERLAAILRSKQEYKEAKSFRCKPRVPRALRRVSPEEHMVKINKNRRLRIANRHANCADN